MITRDRIVAEGGISVDTLCTCTKNFWHEWMEGLGMALFWEVTERDRRCPEHGKPRWPKEQNG